MSLSRLSFAALTVAAVTLIPSSGVIAADDLTDTVREIAAETADLVRQELQLVKIAQTGADLPDRDLTALRAELRTIDDQGAEALDQLDQLEIELTDAIRVVLDRLPQASAPRPGRLDLRPPPPVVYEAAITDLLRISDDPDAVTPIDDGRGPGRGSAASWRRWGWSCWGRSRSAARSGAGPPTMIWQRWSGATA